MALTESCWPSPKPSGSSCDDPHPQTISLAVQLFAVPTSLIRRRVGTGQSGSSMLARNRKRVSRVTAPLGQSGHSSRNRRSFAPRGGSLLYGKTPNGGNYFKPPAGAGYC
jgi:hypothetical protein